MLDRATLTTLQLQKLQTLLTSVLPTNRFMRAKLQAIDPAKITTLSDLSRLPLITKAELVTDQAAHPPYGSNLSYPLARYRRMHQTSGTATGAPLRWLDTAESWQWFLDCWQTIYAVVGLRADDRLFFPFSFGPFIGFWAAFEGAVRLGHFCLPGGGMSTSARLRFMLENAVTVVCCTPTYAQRMAEVAQRDGIDLASSPVRMLIVAGEPGGSIPATRRRIELAWGARVFDHTGMTEIGSLGIECQENPGGVHLLETECIPEVIDPETASVLQPGNEGELVLTNLGRSGSPLLRYRTGDRVVADADPCPCGRPFLRLRGGILGRTDDMMVIRGNNVYPSAMEDVIRQFPEVEEFQIEVESTGPCTTLLVRLEVVSSTPRHDIPHQVSEAIRARLNFRPTVTSVPAGSLPRPEMKSQRLVRKI